MGQNSLKIAVNRYCGSIAKLSKMIGWSYSKTYRIVNLTQEPNLEEMRTLIRALRLDSTEEIVSVFSLR